MNTGVRVLPNHWDPVTRAIKKDESNAAFLIMKIRKEVSQLEAEFTTKSLMGVTLTKNRAKKLQKGKIQAGTFSSFAKIGYHKNILTKKL